MTGECARCGERPAEVFRTDFGWWCFACVDDLGSLQPLDMRFAAPARNWEGTSC